MALADIQIGLVYALLGYPPLAVVLKTVLQIRWAGELYDRYGAAYPYRYFRHRMGWAHYKIFRRRRRRSVHPALLSDLKAAQRRSLLWDLGLGAVWAAKLVAWLALKRVGL
jgi:hypothetical protein